MPKKKNIVELTRCSVEEYHRIEKRPLIVVTDNVRSMHNIGSIFRTADAFLIKEIILGGISGTPPHPEISKTALGAEVTVPTIDGTVKYNIPEGTQPGTVFRFKGKGIKKLGRSDRGNQFVHITIEVPSNLTKKQKDLLREFDGSLDEDKNYKKRNNFFDKIKQAFEK